MFFASKQNATAALKNKFRIQICIAIDTECSAIHFYYIDGTDKATLKIEDYPYKEDAFSKEFISEFSQIVANYANKHPENLSEIGVTLVLPDRVVAMDTVSVPSISRKKNDESLDVAIESLYKNRGKLVINSVLASQNKQLVTYSLSIINSELLTSLKDACTSANMTPVMVTYAANTAAAAAEAINSKLKNASYLLLDIKNGSSHFAFVAKGRVSGFYALPFGSDIISGNRLAAEDVLFEHSTAELIVLNAKEKARAKQLTMMNNESAAENTDVDEEALNDPTNVNVEVQAVTYKTLPKKIARKLPKFMLRETPTDEQGYEYENFRIFMKWALNLIESNDKLSLQGKPETVYVNMPHEFEPLIALANEEKSENEIEFAMLETKEKEIVSNHLELYGGLCSNIAGKDNIF